MFAGGKQPNREQGAGIRELGARRRNRQRLSNKSELNPGFRVPEISLILANVGLAFPPLFTALFNCNPARS